MQALKSCNKHFQKLLLYLILIVIDILYVRNILNYIQYTDASHAPYIVIGYYHPMVNQETVPSV